MSYRLHIFFISLALLQAVSPVKAQTPFSDRELHGQLSYENGTPFTERARITIEDDQGGLAGQLMADARGKFEDIHLYKSRFTITIHANGYHDVITHIDLTADPREYIQVTLHPLPTSASAIAPAAPGATVSVNDISVPEAAQAEFEKGRSLLLDKHKASDSVKSFQKAIQIAPSYPQAHFLLGTAYMDMGKWSDAETSLNKAISLNDKFDAAYLELGACLIEEKKFADAEKPLLRGLELAPDASRGHYDLGRTYYSLNRFQDAEPHARKAVALEPDFPEAHILLGNVLLRLRDGTHALAEFQEYLRLAPNGAFAGPTQELVKKPQAALAENH